MFTIRAQPHGVGRREGAARDAIPTGTNQIWGRTMPGLDSENDVIGRITRIEKGDGSATSNISASLVIRGLTTRGECEVLIAESAARDLRDKLNAFYPKRDAYAHDADIGPGFE